jgi:hypothetical protein
LLLEERDELLLEERDELLLEERDELLLEERDELLLEGDKQLPSETRLADVINTCRAVQGAVTLLPFLDPAAAR